MGCHDGTGSAPQWSIAGTLYDAASGGAAVSAATIEVTDADGNVLQLATASNGNFYTDQAVSFPITVRASKCPSNAPMTDAISGSGSCNQSGCHTSAMRVHLP
jgi:hypothetical protein